MKSWNLKKRRMYRLIDIAFVADNVFPGIQKIPIDTASKGKLIVNYVRERDIPLATEAMEFAIMAISQLERIRKDDSKREDAFKRVINWCNKNI